MARETRAIWTDVAMVVVGDPCRLMPGDAYGEMAARRAFLARHGDPRVPLLLPDHGLVVPTAGNRDGWCRVDVHRGRDGWPTSVVIGLSTRAEKPG